MSQQYSVTFVNNSTNLGDVCVFQKDPNIGVANVQSLAWFTKTTHPNTRAVFKWNIDYSFVWAETGELVPGVQFIASEVLKADLTQNNAVNLSYLSEAYTFTKQKTEQPLGSLLIHQDPNIPLKQASVGIGMSGNGTFAVQAQPNLDLTFTPHPKYYISFGTFTEGEVLDIAQMTKFAELKFNPGVYSITAILNADNTWSIKSTNEVNKELVAARANNPTAQRLP